MAARAEGNKSELFSTPGTARCDFRSADAIVGFDDDLRIRLWNRAAEALTGVPARAVIGRHCWQVLQGVGEDGSSICGPDCPIPRGAREETPPHHQTLLITARGHPKPVWFSTLAVDERDRRGFLHVLCPRPEAGGKPPARPRAIDSRLLTPRQQEVLKLLGAGVRPREIAGRLGISETTVRNHIRAVLNRLECHSQLEAVAEARRRRIL